ncbi:MAG: phospholipase C type enzyme [Alectoria fallacina]|uniref:Phospholipase C type enzyme n=1 Tax=Alectoria fallacina TaxID=1903189 RepID=A0A8H3J3V4_9LECA|nr:MAG: phospholipase C type enzyme [Alectoria fallacina]
MPASSEAPTTLNVISYNCLGLKYISHYRRERLAEIGRKLALASPVPEVVGLQECWTQEDYQSIRRQTKHILPYGKYYYSGIFGGGLAILSKWPIEESSMVRYSLNGRPTAFFRGDWFVGKGVACARIRLGLRSEEVVEVFCTHLHAPYESEPNDSYLCHRTAQAWEIAKLMRGAAERGHLVLGLGDFNMVPLSFAHQLITGYASVRDAWRVMHPQSSIGSANDELERKRGRGIPTARYNLSENGATCDGVLNTWRLSKEQQKKQYKGENMIVDGTTQDPRAKRLDYIFIGGSDHPHLPSNNRWHVQDIKVGMTERHPSIGCSLSDHFSVEATLSRGENPAELAISTGPAGSGNPTFQHVDIDSLSISTYDIILSMIETYTLRERHQRHFRLSNFGISMVVAIGCFTAIWWSPRPFVAFLLMLLSTLGFGAGMLDGLIGGLFIGSELRALKEFEWEIQNAKAVAEEQRRGDQENVNKV